MEIPKEIWTGRVSEVTFGATPDKGGTRGRIITLGGENILPFLLFEGEMPHKPVIAMEVIDRISEDYPEAVKEAFGDCINDPVAWAVACKEMGADAICLKLEGTNPETFDLSAKEAAETVKKVLAAVDLPLLLYGSGHEEKDPKVLELASEAARGERCLLGQATEKEFKSVCAAAQANGHGIVAFSLLDVNLAKQLNILVTDFGMKKEDVIMDPLMAGLGYGLEYSYSCNERIRLAALMGDDMLALPMVCDAAVAWNAREAKENNPEWGGWKKRGPAWEASTGISAIASGANMLIMRHPEAVKIVRQAIDGLCAKPSPTPEAGGEE